MPTKFMRTSPGSILITLHFLCNSGLGPLNLSYTADNMSGTNELIAPIRKLLRKFSFVNTVPSY